MTREIESSLQLSVKLCSDPAAFEARTAKKLSLNMGEVKRTLEESKEYKIVVYTPHIIILKSGCAEITLSRDGRMLIKRVSNEAKATKLAQRILARYFRKHSNRKNRNAFQASLNHALDVKASFSLMHFFKSSSSSWLRRWTSTARCRLGGGVEGSNLSCDAFHLCFVHSYQWSQHSNF